MQHIEIPVAKGTLKGDLELPAKAKALIIFAHGSGSSRLSPRNIQVAKFLNSQGFGTLLFDLLTIEEERGEIGGEYRFNIDLLAERLVLATRFVHTKLPIGYFGASTGAAAALKASTQCDVFAVVSRGGRPDLAEDALKSVKAPTLLIVGSLDTEVIALNKQAKQQMKGDVQLSIIEGATHLFEEPGTLQEVAELAANWLTTVYRKTHPGQ